MTPIQQIILAMGIYALALTCAVMTAVAMLVSATQKQKDSIMADINEQLKTLLTPIAEDLSAAAESVASVGPQLEKAKNEIIAALGGSTSLSPEVLEKFAALGVIAGNLKTAGVALKGTSQALDDLNADETTPTT